MVSQARGSTTYNRVLDRVHVVNDTRVRDRGRIFSLVSMVAFPILASDNVRDAHPRSPLSSGGQLAVRLLHRGVLQQQTLNLFAFRCPFDDRRILRVAGRGCFVRIDGDTFLGHVPFREPGQPQRGRIGLQLLALTVSVRSDFQCACLGVTGLVSPVTSIGIGIEQRLSLRSMVARSFLAPELLRRDGFPVTLVGQHHAVAADGRFQGTVVAHEVGVLPAIVAVISLVGPSIVDGAAIDPLLAFLSHVLVHDRGVRVLQEGARAVQLTRVRGTSRRCRFVRHIVAQRGRSAYPCGQSLQQVRAGVAEYLRHAGGRRGPCVTISLIRRALTRRRHVITWRGYDIKDR